MDKKLNTLKYWYMEEYLLPQEIEHPAKLKRKNKRLFAERGDFNSIVNKFQKKIDENRRSSSDFKWEFTFYGGMFKVDSIRTQLEEAVPSLKFSGFEERPPSGFGASYSFAFSHDGKYKEESIEISTAPWAVHKIVENKTLEYLPYDKFKDMEEELGESIDNLFSVFDGEMFDIRGFIIAASKEVRNIVGGSLASNLDAPIFQVTGVKKKIKKEEEKDTSANDSDFLNSFYLEDLHRAISDNSPSSDFLLSQYLSFSEPKERIDVRDPKNLPKVLSVLSPKNLPDGCWPAAGGYPLVFSQQFAINNITQDIDNIGIYSVNGPPGTGKTTMLRDLIAHIIVDRAKVIAELGENAFGSPTSAWKSGNKDEMYYPIHSAMLGHEIVVASSNNGAVENVTMEIPAEDSIDEAWLSSVDYFKEIGDDIINGPSWGLGAAKLGNSGNKKRFISSFLYDRKEKEEYIDPDGKKKEREVVVRKGFYTLLREANENNSSKHHAFLLAKEEFYDALSTVTDMKEKFEDILSSIREDTTLNDSPMYMLQEMFSKNKKDLDTIKTDLQEKESALKSLPHELSKLSHSIELQRNDVSFLNGKIFTLQQDMESILDEIKSKSPSGMFSKLFFYKKEVSPEVENLKSSLENKNRELKKTTDEMKQKNAALKELLSSQDNCAVLEKDIRTRISSLLKRKVKAENKIVDTESKINNVKKSINNVKKRIQKKLIHLEGDLSWGIKDDIHREKSSPFTSDEEFQAARSWVFIKALALQKAFIELNAKKISLNLSRVKDILENKVSNHDRNPIIEEKTRNILATLFLCVPVLSSTFASYSRMFPLWNEKLGWLLVDEAGQAVAKAAVGALKRSSRAVIVGDPFQLEPIIGLSAKVQEALRREYNAPEEMLSKFTSAQIRGDFIQPWGTYIDNGTGPVWVGSPLRVHRRCHSPMFEISNNTTYSKMMIQGKGKDDSKTLRSQWIDVSSDENIGHWIPAEGEAVRKIIEKLHEEGIQDDEIYLISPFRDVVNGLKKMFNPNKEFYPQVGTIHTVQGKEAKAVFVVLGSDPKNEGARDWASEKPNLLNVAVTRAKDRVFLVGNMNKWINKPYFSTAVELLMNK